MENRPGSFPYRRVLVPFDGSPGSRKALEKAVLLAHFGDAEITALWVDEDVPRYAPGVGVVEEEPEVRAEEFSPLKAHVEAVAKEKGLAIKIDCGVGHAAQTILRYAQENGFDVIVIGQSGHSGAWGMLLGSTTARVVDHASCDVLVVR